MGVHFRTIDHTGATVISKLIPLSALGSSPREEEDAESDLDTYAPLSLRALGASAGGDPRAVLAALDGDVVLQCEPHWGDLPRYRLLLSKSVLAIAAFVFVLVPLAAALWALHACFYRVTRGHDDAEEARRAAGVSEVRGILAALNAKKSS